MDLVVLCGRVVAGLRPTWSATGGESISWHPVHRPERAAGTSRFNSDATGIRRMSLETERYCPECDGERTFWRVASTELHLGRKVKWRCGECDYGFVRIGEGVDTGADA
jgi:hypothetical protein